MKQDERVQEILELEQKLRQAFLQRDVATLDQLISDDVSITDPLGRTISKKQDLDMHRSGDLVINSYDASEINIRVYDSIAIVTLRVRLQLHYKMQAIDGDYRYIRVYRSYQGQWQIIAAQITSVAT